MDMEKVNASEQACEQASEQASEQACEQVKILYRLILNKKCGNQDSKNSC